ncbi:hypothetical protein BSL78_28185 [Apostichopus japonicus]|uniref:ZU5 domain-containing protein n=1 Tax=Stichopus japonicus TaxID=307972 RepID=A0A2G8JGV5_STIJA|nr:hypothetical protein BSL78_28185 [Apostichopus japonicus]
MVGIAEDLTLDNTLRLAALFRLSPAQTNQLRRVSLIETPGITLLNVIKTQNIINMYDVTNLQKGLLCIQLNRTNENLLVPYQAKIGQFQFEENQTPKLLDWPDKTFASVDEATLYEESTEREETEEHPEHDEELPRTKKDSQIHHMRRSHSYMEHKINFEGGTMSVMGICLTIPKDALSNDHVISVKVKNHNDVSLPVIACGSRMTPVIQLEPEGLTFNKPARLTVPHSALISETDCQRVTVFAGRKHEENLQTGEITWNEEETTDCKLDREKISFDINILSYIFVTLVSQETEQKHIFRVVSFIDGILDAKEDLLITVCFSKDSEEDYKMLLEDYSSKLSLGNYKTIQITRTLGGDRDETSHIELMVFSKNDSYHLTKEESSKHVEIDHLCAASRVSHQFRLKRNPDVDNDMVDVRLKVSQTEENELTVFLQTKFGKRMSRTLPKPSSGMDFKLDGYVPGVSDEVQNSAMAMKGQMEWSVSSVVNSGAFQSLAPRFDLGD